MYVPSDFSVQAPHSTRAFIAIAENADAGKRGQVGRGLRLRGDRVDELGDRLWQRVDGERRRLRLRQDRPVRVDGRLDLLGGVEHPAHELAGCLELELAQHVVCVHPVRRGRELVDRDVTCVPQALGDPLGVLLGGRVVAVDPQVDDGDVGEAAQPSSP